MLYRYAGVPGRAVAVLHSFLPVPWAVHSSGIELLLAFHFAQSCTVTKASDIKTYVLREFHFGILPGLCSLTPRTSTSEIVCTTLFVSIPGLSVPGRII